MKKGEREKDQQNFDGAKRGTKIWTLVLQFFLPYTYQFTEVK